MAGVVRGMADIRARSATKTSAPVGLGRVSEGDIIVPTRQGPVVEMKECLRAARPSNERRWYRWHASGSLDVRARRSLNHA
jgi:hypothetical protein